MWSLILMYIATLSCVAFVGIACLTYLFDRREWNKGWCGECMRPWAYCDTDFRGQRLYRCPNCKRTIWIFWLREKPHGD